MVLLLPFPTIAQLLLDCSLTSYREQEHHHHIRTSFWIRTKQRIKIDELWKWSEPRRLEKQQRGKKRLFGSHKKTNIEIQWGHTLWFKTGAWMYRRDRNERDFVRAVVEQKFFLPLYFLLGTDAWTFPCQHDQLPKWLTISTRYYGLYSVYW